MHRRGNRFAWAMMVVALVIGSLAWSAQAAGPFYDGIVNKDFKRTIQLTTALARHEYTITMVNEGSEAQNHFHLTVQSLLSSKLAYVSAADADGTSLAVKYLEKPQEIVGADGHVAETYASQSVTRFLQPTNFFPCYFDPTQTFDFSTQFDSSFASKRGFMTLMRLKNFWTTGREILASAVIFLLRPIFSFALDTATFDNFAFTHMWFYGIYDTCIAHKPRRPLSIFNFLCRSPAFSFPHLTHFYCRFIVPWLSRFPSRIP
jgi:hypothetical protein